MAHEAHIRTGGYTLVELMVTLAVLAVTLTIGVPAFAGVIQRAREANAYHLLTASLAAARIAAVKDGTAVSVCPSPDGARCRGDAVWEGGWIVYSDPGDVGQPRNARAGLQHVEGIGPGLALRSTSGRKRVRFTPDGWSYGRNLSVRLCGLEGSRLLGKVVVNNAGRPRSERYGAGEPCPYLL